ncbi:MAG: hypothetical protein V4850_27045 [Myxococcota bacterium]
MNLFEALFIFASLCLGSTASAWISGEFGWVWALPAFGVFTLVLPGLLVASHAVRRWLYPGGDAGPPCSCGGPMSYEKVGSESHLCCQSCGTRYERRQGTAWRYDPAGNTVFRRLRMFWGWV